MNLLQWIASFLFRFRNNRQFASRARNRRSHGILEPLEPRVLLAFDLGDAPDRSIRTGVGDYQTLLSNKGPSHRIDETRTTLFLGKGVDAETGTYQNLSATMDDWTIEPRQTTVTGSDEDGIIGNAELGGTIGNRPAIRVRVTNSTAKEATLSGWLDADRNGVFDNLTERVQYRVTSGTTDGEAILVFPELRMGSAGTTFLRLRLSTDAASFSSTGPAIDGEVEDHLFVIRNPLNQPITFLKSVTVGDRINGGPDIGYTDFFGWDSAPIGDLNRDGIADLVVTAPADGGVDVARGAVYVLFFNSTGSVRTSMKIGNRLNGGPVLMPGDVFGESVTSLGDIDGDGFPEIAVGATGDDTGGKDRGAIYVVSLTKTGTAKRVTKIASSVNGGPILPNGAGLGAVESIGDIDGDGVTDLIVGAPTYKIGTLPDQGKLFLMLMNKTGTAKPAIPINVNRPAGHTQLPFMAFGEEIAFLGDAQRDGTVEIVVLSEKAVQGRQPTHFLDVLSIDRTGAVRNFVRNTMQEITKSDSADSDTAGHLSAIGDQNGDGLTDIAYLRGSTSYETGTWEFASLSDKGKLENLPKRSEILGPQHLSLTLRFGASITNLGDLNNDGSAEFVVGIPSYTIDSRNKRMTGGLSVVTLLGDAPKTKLPGTPIASGSHSNTYSDAPSIRFGWFYSDWARTYEIEFWNVSTSSLVQEAKGLRGGPWFPSIHLPLGKYGFKVRARNEVGASPWSEIQYVTVDTKAITNSIPIKEHFGSRAKITWQPLDGAERYELRIFDDKNAVVHSAFVNSGVDYTLECELPRGAYQYSVRGIAKDGTPGSWSDVWGQPFKLLVPVVAEVVGDPVAIQPAVRFPQYADADSYELEFFDLATGVMLQRESAKQPLIFFPATLSAGEYAVRGRPIDVTGRPGPWSESQKFDVLVAPTLMEFPGEINGSVNRHLSLKWSNVNGATSAGVRVQLPSVDSSVAPSEAFRYSATSEYVETSKPEQSVFNRQGRFLVSVRAAKSEWGIDRAFVGHWSEPVGIIVKYQVDGVVTDPQTSEIRWAEVPGASHYQIQITKRQNGQTLTVVDQITERINFKHDQPLAMDSYSVQVRAISPDGTVGYWSTVKEFYSRPRPILINKESQWIWNAPVLQWEPLKNAVSYNVRIKTLGDPDWSYKYYNDITSTQFTLPGVLINSYEWSVSANLDVGPTGVWSLSGRLTISSSPYVLSVETDVTSTAFSWTRIDDAKYYEIKVADGYRKVVYHAADLTSNEIEVPLAKWYNYRVWVRAISGDGKLSDWSFVDFYIRGN